MTAGSAAPTTKSSLVLSALRPRAPQMDTGSRPMQIGDGMYSWDAFVRRRLLNDWEARRATHATTRATQERLQHDARFSADDACLVARCCARVSRLPWP